MTPLKNLSCRKRVEILCSYLDGEVPPALKKAIESHRQGCLPCEALLEDLKGVIARLKKYKKAVKTPAQSHRTLISRLSPGQLS